MKIDVLMSTMNKEKIEDVITKSKNIKRAIIVCQTDDKDKKNIKFKNYKMYFYQEKGISKSRNRLLQNCESEIGIITDDDISFVADYESLVLDAYKKYNDADIITFNIKIGDKVVGNYKHKRHTKISVLGVVSCQITFKTNSIKNKVKFDERFGLGTNFKSGEENIFLKEALNKGLKIYHVNTILCTHPAVKTTGEIWNDEVIIGKGALSYRLFGKCSIFFKLYLLIFKYSQYKKSYSIFKFIKLLKQGEMQYKKK